MAKEKKGSFIWKSGPGLYKSVVNQKVKNGYMQRRNPVFTCLLSRCWCSDIFVVHRSFVMLTTDFIEMLSSLSQHFVQFCQRSLMTKLIVWRYNWQVTFCGENVKCTSCIGCYMRPEGSHGWAGVEGKESKQREHLNTKPHRVKPFLSRKRGQLSGAVTKQLSWGKN